MQAKELVGENGSKGKRILMTTLISTVPGICIFILLPSVLFCHIEDNWTYLDGVYYAFVNIVSHIAFGDLINIHRNQEAATRLGSWMWAYRVVKHKLAPLIEQLCQPYERF